MKRVYLLTATDPHALLEDLEHDDIPVAVDLRRDGRWSVRMGRHALRRALEQEGRMLYTIPEASAEALDKRFASMGVSKAAVWVPAPPGAKQAYERLMTLGRELAKSGCLVFDPMRVPVIHQSTDIANVAGDEVDQVAPAEASVYVNEETNTDPEETNTPPAGDPEPTITLVLERTTLAERLAWVALKGRCPLDRVGVFDTLERDGCADVSESVAHIILNTMGMLLEEAGGWAEASPLRRVG